MSVSAKSEATARSSGRRTSEPIGWQDDFLLVLHSDLGSRWGRRMRVMNRKARQRKVIRPRVITFIHGPSRSGPSFPREPFAVPPISSTHPERRPIPAPAVAIRSSRIVCFEKFFVPVDSTHVFIKSAALVASAWVSGGNTAGPRSRSYRPL